MPENTATTPSAPGSDDGKQPSGPMVLPQAGARLPPRFITPGTTPPHSGDFRRVLALAGALVFLALAAFLLWPANTAPVASDVAVDGGGTMNGSETLGDASTSIHFSSADAKTGERTALLVESGRMTLTRSDGTMQTTQMSEEEQQVFGEALSSISLDALDAPCALNCQPSPQAFTLEIQLGGRTKSLNVQADEPLGPEATFLALRMRDFLENAQSLGQESGRESQDAEPEDT